MTVLVDLDGFLQAWRDVILGAVSFILGWLVAYYYQRQQGLENRELKALVSRLRHELRDPTLENVQELVSHLQLVPESLLERLELKTQKQIRMSHNEDILHARDELEKTLRQVIGEEHWNGFASAFGLILHKLLGKPTTVKAYLLDLESYAERPPPVGMWYNAFCTCLILEGIPAGRSTSWRS